MTSQPLKLETLNTLSDAYGDLSCRLAEFGISMDSVNIIAGHWTIRGRNGRGQTIVIEFHENDLAEYLEHYTELKAFMAARLSVKPYTYDQKPLGDNWKVTP